jgi:hypothetical protein
MERSCYHCRSGKAINITHTGFVFVAIGTQHVTRMRHVELCDLPGSKIFFHVISQTARFSNKKSYCTQNAFCVFCANFVWNIAHSKKNLARCCRNRILVFMWGIRYSSHIFMKVELSQQIFKNIFKYEISWKSVKWERWFFMRTDTQLDRRTDRQTYRHDEAYISFRNFANASKNCI